MCTFYIDDILVDSVRSSFKDETDLNKWMTEQMSVIIRNFAATQPAGNAKWRNMLAEALDEKYK